MSNGYNPNFRGRCQYDTVASLSPVPINIVPPIPYRPPHYPPVIDLTCGTQGNSGDITKLCAPSIFRTDSVVSNRRYYARMCTVTAPEGIITLIVVSQFASYITLWKDAGHYWTSTNGTLTAPLDADTSGVLAFEVTTANPYVTGSFTVDLSCGGSEDTGGPIASFQFSLTAPTLGGDCYDLVSWSPADQAGNTGPGTVIGLGTFYATAWGAGKGIWNVGQEVTFTFLQRRLSLGKFIGLRYKDSSGVWQWIVPSDPKRVWTADYDWLGADNVVVCTPSTLVDGDGKVFLDAVYDSRVLVATNSYTGAHTLGEQVMANSGTPGSIFFEEFGYASWLHNAGAFTAGGYSNPSVTYWGALFTGSGVGSYTWDSYMYQPNPITPPSPLPTCVMTRGGNNGWAKGLWTP